MKWNGMEQCWSEPILYLDLRNENGMIIFAFILFFDKYNCNDNVHHGYHLVDWYELGLFKLIIIGNWDPRSK